MTEVHLTFDNGPHPEVTPQVLDVLARHGVSATFFVLGTHLATPEGEAMARRVVAAGHRLGHHSYSHEVPLGDDARPDTVARELQATHDLLAPLWFGRRWFRPFGGGGELGPHLLCAESVDWLTTHGYSCVLWNVVPGDWLDADGWVEAALAQVEQVAAEGDPAVVVLHDILPVAMQHLDRFVQALRDRGAVFTDAMPPSCMPIVGGDPQPGLERYVASIARG